MLLAQIETMGTGNPYKGFVLAVLFCLAGTGIGALLVGRLVQSLPKTAQWGLCGGIGLGFVGLATFFLGLFGFPDNFVPYFLVLAVIGAFGIWRHRQHLFAPGGAESVALPALVFFILLTRLPAALTPSTGADWDSISHQMAMSKEWISDGKLSYIPWMHHSNIPATVNLLYVWGLDLGGHFGEGINWFYAQAGAKTIAWMLGLFAILSVGGLTAHRFGRTAGNVAALAFAVTPVVLWEFGTAYQDVSHALFAGSAMILAAFAFTERKREYMILAGILLGFGLGTKYTAFQFGAALGLTLLLAGLLVKNKGEEPAKPARGLVQALWIGLIALVLASPWYVRNVVNTGNPVYPFYYSVFDGKNWSEANAHAYAVEQSQFGIGQQYDASGEFTGRSPTAIPGSVTALAIQPDRQINGGLPLGAIGPLFVIGILFWIVSGKSKAEHGLLISMIAISLLTWFFLTQQSRYIITLMVPGAFLIGGAFAALPRAFSVLTSTGIALQSAYTLYLFVWLGLQPEVGALRAEINQLAAENPPEHYLTEAIFENQGDLQQLRFPFWEANSQLNEIGAAARAAGQPPPKVALFDEVRGYYLTVPYMWANPGVHTLIPYDKIKTAKEFVDALRSLGVTHVYINLDANIIGQDRRLYLSSKICNVADWFTKEEPPQRANYQQWILDSAAEGLMQLYNTYDQPLEPIPNTSDMRRLPPRGLLLQMVQPEE